MSNEHDTDMHHDGELDELLGAYALDAIDVDERRLIDEYLVANPRAAAEVQQHREVATLLAYSGAEAPDGIWDRIAASLEEPAPAPGPELARVLPIDAVRQRRSRLASFGTWVAATAAAALIAVAVVSIVDRGSTSDPLLLAVEDARSDRDSRTARLVTEGSAAEVEAVIDPSGHGFLVADQLPRLSSDLTYQLWGVVGDDVISIGILGPRPSIEAFTARADIAALAVTIESAGGVVSDGNPDGAFVGELT